MSAPPKVLVTGADQHQGLAVIRGLGLAGIPVIACGASPWSMGFHSRFAVERARYTPPFQSPPRFIDTTCYASFAGPNRRSSSRRSSPRSSC